MIELELLVLAGCCGGTAERLIGPNEGRQGAGVCRVWSVTWVADETSTSNVSAEIATVRTQIETRDELRLRPTANQLFRGS